MKKLTLEDEICAFMLAIVHERHVVSVANKLEYRTSAELCVEANVANSEKSKELIVDASAVHQSFKIFRKSLLAIGIDMLIISPKNKAGKAMDSFRNFRAFSNGWKIKFNSETVFPIAEDLHSRILEKRNLLIKRSLFDPSEYNDIRVINYEILLNERGSSFLSPNYIPRKKVSSLGKRYLDSLITEVISEVSTQYSTDETDSIALMKSIADVAEKKYRKLDIATNLFAARSDDSDKEFSDSGCASCDKGDSDGTLSDSEFDAFCNAIPIKKIKYTTVERAAVVSLFEKVKDTYQQKCKPKSNYAISKKVKYILRNSSGYAKIYTRNIHNWYRNKKKVLGKKGVKVISLFEEEVLGNLMICTLENADNVSNIFSYPLLNKILLLIQLCKLF